MQFVCYINLDSGQVEKMLRKNILMTHKMK